MIESQITLTESTGPWLRHTVEDIVHARSILECGEHTSLVIAPHLGYNIPVDVYTSPKISLLLDKNISQTLVSYKEFLEKNNIANIIEDSELNESTVLVSYENDTVQINNIEIQSLSEKAGEQE